MKYQTLLAAAILAALTVFGSVQWARADTYQFSVISTDGSFSALFDLPSNPVPLGTDTSGYSDFYLAAPSGLPAGDFVTFYTGCPPSTVCGGMSIGNGHDDLLSGTLLLDGTGPQLFTGTVGSPQFLTGGWDLTNLLDSTHPVSLVITDISTPPPTPTPLPAALPLFATGLAGLGLLGWRRKRKAQA